LFFEDLHQLSNVSDSNNKIKEKKLGFSKKQKKPKKKIPFREQLSSILKESNISG
jgi:hypothetical protein